MTVGVVDTGVDVSHAMLRGADIDGITIYQDRNRTFLRQNDFCHDEKAHGTPIVAVILAHAVQLKIFIVKVGSFDSTITEMMLTRAIAYLLEYTDARIINISMGARTKVVSQELLHICNKASRKGVVVVSAAHSQPGQLCYPAHFGSVWGVGEANVSEIDKYYFFGNDLTNIFTKGNFKGLPFPKGQFSDCKGTSFATANFTGIISNAYLNNEWNCNATLTSWIESNSLNSRKNINKKLKIMSAMEPYLNNQSHIAKDVSDSVSKEYFNEEYGFPAIPVLFTRAFHNMPIKKIWSIEYLSKRLTHKELVNSCDGAVTGVEMTLTEYLTADKSTLYYYKTCSHLSGPLNCDFETPPVFDCWYKNTASGNPSKNLSWLYVGGKGTYSDFHIDIWETDAWNYLVSGKKLWLIYPKTYSAHIRKHLDKISVKNLHSEPAEMFSQECKPLVCIQEAGELIYVPGGYYHAVYNLDLTVSLTENFFNEINYDNVRSYFRGTANRKNILAVDSIIKEGFLKIKNQNT